MKYTVYPVINNTTYNKNESNHKYFFYKNSSNNLSNILQSLYRSRNYNYNNRSINAINRAQTNILNSTDSDKRNDINQSMLPRAITIRQMRCVSSRCKI